MRDLFATLGAERLAGAVPAAIVRTDAPGWIEAARTVREGAGRLVAIWGADHRDRDGAFSVLAAYDVTPGLLVTELAVPASQPSYPGIAGLFPAAARMQRTVRDLLGLAADDQEDRRPWLRHGAWREDEFPLRRDFGRSAQQGIAPDGYAFVRVEGDGVHEIPVGPIHAGVIEPGHFRFSIVGEKVLRLEEHLGYTHKGIDKRFEDFALGDGHRLAGRVSGDSTVAYAWAYAQAAEGILALSPPPRAAWLRALLLERERIANHLGDLGALGNDGGFAFALAQFMRLKEDWLRANAEVFGHRYAMDVIVPGGVASDPGYAGLQRLAADAGSLRREVTSLRRIFDEHSGLQDRFITAGRVTPDLARRLGLVGLGGRASGQAFDLRVDHPVAPYDTLTVKKVVYVAGDVAARVHGRFDELAESIRLCEAIAAGIPGARRARHSRRAGRDSASAGWKAGGVRSWWRWKAMPRDGSGAATPTTRRGTTGRCSSTRSWATSSRTSRSSTRAST
jgi:Ni,Fe-hydrogenase III large subunit/Ni,Fe-hydrogenase III component G